MGIVSFWPFLNKKGYEAPLLSRPKRRKSGATKSFCNLATLSLNEIRVPLQTLKRNDFAISTCNKRGYMLRGSIWTNGFCLQLPAIKLKELLLVRYKRHPTNTWIKLRRLFDADHKAQYMAIETLADVEKMVNTFLAVRNVEEEEEEKQMDLPTDDSNNVQLSTSCNTRSTPTHSARKSSSGGSRNVAESLRLLDLLRCETSFYSTMMRSRVILGSCLLEW
ncbi:hypothetical protein BGZ99_002462 [Dissophora globulifera]|uniref:Uncharacterized protein n=1 Tax=Dissophora globulifera TaxID=979702 RepID=A0A9P6UIX1_9FUNG|nr:hypothetical protein BGZ99_002462 [Dissophora globulifera]